MTVAIRYYSGSGSTRKVANAIAKAVGVNAETCEVGIAEKVDLLFVGSGVYAGNIHKSTRAFLESLTPEKVGKVVVFSTAAGPNTPLAIVRELLAKSGIPVSDKEYHCRGKFLFAQRGHPNDEDLQQAEAFAKGFFV